MLGQYYGTKIMDNRIKTLNYIRNIREKNLLVFDYKGKTKKINEITDVEPGTKIDLYLNIT